jgi:XTP/dITP diphosphohydrolase
MRFQLKGIVIFLATNNINKFNEARKVLTEYGISVGMLRTKSLEIQSESLIEIAKSSALDAFGRINLPMIVEDAGLFIDALNGFPGPYAAYVYKTIGNKGLLRLMEDVKSRNARFQSVIAYCSRETESPLCFEGEAAGEMTKEERRGNGSSGFGFDPVFRPVGSDRTFAEMSLAEKNGFSHRASALRKFAKWYEKFRG